MIRLRKPARRTRRVFLGSTLDRLEARALMAFAGSVDPTFGVGGIYFAALNTGASTGLSSVSAVAVEADGSILEAGIAGKDVDSGSATLGVIHLTASGAPDPSFGNGGEADVPLPSGQASRTSVALLVQPNGAILVSGTFTPSGATTPSTVVERFMPDGTPDPTFGTDGQAIIDSTAVAGASFQYAALQPNGQIDLAGSAPNPQSTNGSTAVAVTRLDANGQLDTSFGTNGLAILYDATQAEITGTTVQRESALGLAIQANDQVVVLATQYASQSLSGLEYFQEADIYRLNADGTRDTSLSQAALQSSILTAPSPDGVAVLSGGQILVLGYNSGGFNSGGASYFGPALVELNGDGSLTTASDLARPLGVAKGSSFPVPTGLGVEPNGDIVFGVDTFMPSGSGQGTHLTVVRLKPDLTPDATFGNAGLASIPLPVPTPPTTGSIALADTLAITPSGQIIVGGVSMADTQSATTQYNIVTRLDPTGTSAHQGDFTGDGISDPAIYLPAYGAFAIGNSSGGPGEIVPFGIPGPGQTIPAPGNYYGTGQDDIAAYLPTFGAYAIQDPTGKTAGIDIPFGIAGPGQTVPAPGDYYGTGQDDIAVYLVQSGTFAILAPSLATGQLVPFGIPGAGQSIPVPGDYYGTGKDDIAVYLAASAVWAILSPDGTTGEVIPFGKPGIGQSIPVPGDYDNSGKTELAVYVPSLAEIIYRPANGGADVTIPFGMPGQGNTLPAPGDYDGSGKTEAAAYLPSLGIFAYRPANGGADVYDSIGVPGQGQTIPVTTVVLSPFPGIDVGADAIDEPGVMGEADPLDFLILPTSAKKSKPADQSA